MYPTKNYAYDVHSIAPNRICPVTCGIIGILFLKSKMHPSVLENQQWLDLVVNCPCELLTNCPSDLAVNFQTVQSRNWMIPQDCDWTCSIVTNMTENNMKLHLAGRTWKNTENIQMKTLIKSLSTATCIVKSKTDEWITYDFLKSGSMSCISMRVKNLDCKDMILV